MADFAEHTKADLPAIAPGTTVAVTGATGFIGGRLVELLAQGGAEVTCLTRGLANTRLHRAGARIRALDLADPAAVTAALEGIELVFHLAYDWASTEWNSGAMRALIAGCRENGCRRLVHISSFVVYESPDEGQVTEDAPPVKASEGYPNTKLALETLLLEAVREQGLPAVILQPTIVYGPFSQPWTMDSADTLRYGTVVLPGQGEGVCDAVYVDDVVSAMILAAEKPGAVGQRYLISGPSPITWRDFYEGMAQAADAKGPQYWPLEAIARVNARPKLVRLLADPERIVRKAAGIGPARKLAEAGLRVLPRRLGSKVRTRLFGPAMQRPGFVHVPDPGLLRLLQSRAPISSAKARRELGYAPSFSFEQGMVPTARFLREHYPKRG